MIEVISNGVGINAPDDYAIWINAINAPDDYAIWMFFSKKTQMLKIKFFLIRSFINST